MEIIEIKKKKANKYELKIKTFDNTISLSLFEEVLIELNILKPKKINKDEYELLLKKNKFYEGFYSSIKYLKHNHSKKELIEYLEKKDLYDILVIKKLEELNLINDLLYKDLMVDNLKQKKVGKNFIVNKLKEKGLSTDDISYSIKEERKNMNDLIIKEFNALKNKTISKKNLEFKIKSRLLLKGYKLEEYQNIFNDLDLDFDETLSLEKEFMLAKMKYNDKYKIFNYLLRKGYAIENIKQIVGGLNDD